MKISIANKLKENNMSRYQLAAKTDITYPTIDKMYKSKSLSVKLDNLEAICRVLNCTPNDILIFDDEQIQEKINLVEPIKKGDTN